jgi:hypothetical protein
MEGRADWEIGLRLFFSGTRRRVDGKICTDVTEKLAANICRDHEDARISDLTNNILFTLAEYVAEF